ncbi:MAG TPA: hypothetical protein VMS17_06570 [Gemmataceae bacterium]|nr:hypothetical protein [Gemmataceae bacterium]
MNIFLPLLACVLPIAAPGAMPPADAGPTQGKVLVLENEQTMCGDVERIGDVYHVRRLIGETAVPAERVLRLCASVEEALAFVRSRANLTDPDERLRLAEWCRQNGLHDEAVAEVRAAVALRPDYAPCRRLLAYLEGSKPTAAATPTETPVDAPKPVDLTEESLGQFAVKVQPILMNACANCHSTGRGGGFKLTRTYDAAMLNRKALQQNLAAVLAEVNLSQPQNSPLLSKAVSVHGPLEQAPFKNRQAPAYRTLEDWVKSTLADNPQLFDAAPPRTAAAAAPPAAPAGPTPFAETHPAALSNANAPAKSQALDAPTPAAVPAAPEPPDPYSPDGFNRQFHADKSPNSSPPKP